MNVRVFKNIYFSKQRETNGKGNGKKHREWRERWWCQKGEREKKGDEEKMEKVQKVRSRLMGERRKRGENNVEGEEKENSKFVFSSELWDSFRSIIEEKRNFSKKKKKKIMKK